MAPHDDLLQQIRQKVHHPATARELMRVLRVPREGRQALTRQLRALADAGSLVMVGGNRFGLPDLMDLVVGRFEGHPSGFGFVIPERPVEGVQRDIYVGEANVREAMHGDRVVVRIERRRDDGRAEGQIVQILDRRSRTVVGRFEAGASGLGYVVPFDRRLIADIHIPRGDSLDAAPGEMVTAAITQWPTPSRGPVGQIVQVLGGIDEPGVDTEIILRKHAIPDDHNAEAVAEAQRIGSSIKERDIRGRTDFRDRPVVTIDGEHARDFDDAISIHRLASGNFWLGVHIADVAHYVREGSALDTDAYERGTSVYFPERAVHMFPPELATGVCSLNPHVDRLVQSCLMEIDAQGQVVRYELHDGVIRSTERMTYTAVNAILTDNDPAFCEKYRALVPMFETMHELFAVLNGRRRRRGAIDFDMPEPEVILDDEGRIENIVASERNIAHRIIEELMLLANETVAGHLESKGMPALYRIHEPPDPLKVLEFDAFVSSLGFALAAPPGTVRPTDFQKLVEKIRGTPEEKPIAFLMLRTMQKARYDAMNVGHFGLAAETYTHFTSPIRRYPDLVVHRLLRELRTGRVTEDRKEELAEELPEVGRHTSEMERRADEAERELMQWKKVRFMADKVGDLFDGYITGVAPFGLFIELIDHFVEGLVHVSTMADDYYRYHEQGHTLFGESTRKTYRLGDRVRVQVVRVDMDRRQIDLGLADVLDRVRKDERSRGAPRSQARPKKGERKATPEQRRRARKQRMGKKERSVRKRR
ncbi:MAG: ribonuclease R [Acidobacteria bacterium]|nr:ribonuclease R [Acidobacteriota bacterium]